MDNGRWVTINGAHVFVKDGQSPMDAFIRQKGGKSDYENIENLSKSKALNKNYSDSLDKARDKALEFYKEIGYDGKPKIVTKEEYDKLKSEGAREIARGIRGYGIEGKNGQDFYDQYKSGEMYIGSQRVFGSGTYYSYENDVKDTISRYSNADGLTHTALIDKSAKIITDRKLNELKAEYGQKMMDKALQLGNKDPQLANEYYTKMNNVINMDNGIFASSLGYDAIDVEDAQYIVSLNRSKIILVK